MYLQKMSEKQKTSFRDFANEYHPARLRPGFHRKTIVQLVRALHRYRRGQASNPGKSDFFFQAFFSQLHKLR